MNPYLKTPAPIEVPSQWIEPHKLARIRFGVYEKDEKQLVHDHLDPNIDTIELGCGVGVISSEVCRKLLPGAKFIGVEGNPELVEVASRNVMRFPNQSVRKIEHAVIGGANDDGRTRSFFITPGNFHMSSLTGEDGGKEIKVPQVSLSSLLKLHEVDEFQLVADVEGAELEVLENDPEALQSCSRLIIELHQVNNGDKEVTKSDLANKIEALGFRREKQLGDVYYFERNAKAA